MKFKVSRSRYFYLLQYLSLLTVFLSFGLGAAETFKLEELGESGEVNLKLYVFDCGEIEVRNLSVFNASIPKGTVKTLSNACYLIVHPKGTLFWDGGLSDTLVTQAGGVEFADGLFNFKVTRTLKSQFEEVGIDPLTVDYIALSHLHGDHTGNASYFSNAKWLIQKTELDVAFTPEGVALGFVPDDYKILQENAVTLEGHYDVFDDKSVVIISTPGHTPGHQSLYINLPETGQIVLSGDLYHFHENRVKYGIPAFNATIRETVHSFVLIDNLLDKTNAKLWIQHDKPFFDSLNLSPAYYQ